MSFHFEKISATAADSKARKLLFIKKIETLEISHIFVREK